MKTQIKLLLSALLIVLISKQGFSQSDIAGLGGHVGIPGYYVGWNGGTAIPLNIQHLNNLNINFRTNFAAAPPGAGNRMIIMNGGFGNFGGFIAMGNNLPNGFIPQSRLHLHQSTLFPILSGPYMRFTNVLTGATAADGFLIGIDPTVTPTNPLGNSVARLNQLENFPIQFWMLDVNLANNQVTRAEFTSGSQMANGGDGLRFWNPGYNFSAPYQPISALDIWVAPANTTHIRWDGSGLIQGSNNRFEQYGNRRGLYFEARRVDAFNPQIEFWINQIAGPALIPAVGLPIPLNVGTFLWDGNGDNIFDGNFGVHTGVNPGSAVNTVEINSTTYNVALNTFVPIPANQFNLLNSAGPTRSGLRFTNLNATMAVDGAANSSNTFLSVNNTGDVILVPGGGGVTSLLCSNPASLLPVGPGNNARVGLNGNNFYFDGNGSGNSIDNSVLIGLPCSNTPTAKLVVFQASTVANTVGIDVINSDPGTVGPIPTIGIRSSVNSISGGCYKVAGWFNASPLNSCSAIAGQYAIFVPQGGGTTSLGFNFSTNTPSTNWDLQVMNGALLGNSNFWNVPSDLRIKTDVSAFTDGLNVIRQINPKRYKYNGKAGLSTNDTIIGIIADSVQLFAPYAINTWTTKLDSTDVSPTDLLSFDAGPIFFASINAIKQLDSTNTEQQLLIDSLFTIIANNNLRISNSSSNNINVNLESDIILYQNYPNPFSGETIIKYYIPTNINSAKMLFIDETGRLIKEVDITTTGDGQVTVNTQDLASGIYTYSLEVNGKNIQTRKMQKVN